jgi:hypothetical protein
MARLNRPIGRRAGAALLAGLAAAAARAGIAFADKPVKPNKPGKPSKPGKPTGAGQAGQVTKPGKPGKSDKLGGAASLKRRHGGSGWLTRLDGSTLTLATKHGDLLVVVDGGTQFRTKNDASYSLDRLRADHGALSAGQRLRLNVRGEPDTGASQPTLKARQVMVHPAKANQKGPGQPAS